MAIAAALAGRNYDYTPFTGQSFYAYNIEQQAQMVQDRFLLRRGYGQTWRPQETGDATLPLLNQVIPF